jgi:hypothetical protein
MDGGRLYPGQCTAVVIDAQQAAEAGASSSGGWALIIRGALEDAAGHEFRWLEQIVAAEPPPDRMVGAGSSR